MSRAKSSDLLRQVRTLFGVGVVAGMSDAELLERFTTQGAADADATLAADAAFAALVARQGPMVLGVCRRALADQGDVEDAFQATFLVLVRRARSVRACDSLGRWLYGAARRVAAKARARSGRARVRSAPLEVDPVGRESSGDQVELLAALDEEVSRLPEKYRAPVVLCHLEGLTHAEAADRLRWPVGTVSGRLSRARDLLKDRLVRRGLAPTAGSMLAMLAAEGARAAVPESLAASTVRSATRLALGGMSHAGEVGPDSLEQDHLAGVFAFAGCVNPWYWFPMETPRNLDRLFGRLAEALKGIAGKLRREKPPAMIGIPPSRRPPIAADPAEHAVQFAHESSDAVIAHEQTEVETGSHDSAEALAPDTALPIREGGRRILRAIAGCHKH